MKLKALVLCLICCLTLTACSSDYQSSVDDFNTKAAATVERYDTVISLAKGKEVELIQGIVAGDISDFPTKSDIDFTPATNLMLSNENSFIDSTPLIQSAGYFTSVDANSVIQYIVFNVSGTSYSLQVLWTDEIDTISLEVKA